MLSAWRMQVLMKNKTTTATSKSKTNTDRKQNIKTTNGTYILKSSIVSVLYTVKLRVPGSQLTQRTKFSLRPLRAAYNGPFAAGVT